MTKMATSARHRHEDMGVSVLVLYEKKNQHHERSDDCRDSSAWSRADANGSKKVKREVNTDQVRMPNRRVDRGMNQMGRWLCLPRVIPSLQATVLRNVFSSNHSKHRALRRTSLTLPNTFHFSSAD